MKLTTQGQRYAHSCPDCRYLESREVGGVHYDALYCPQGEHPTLLLRYGNEGHEYLSSQLDFALEPIPTGAKEAMRQRYEWVRDMRVRFNLKTWDGR